MTVLAPVCPTPAYAGAGDVPEENTSAKESMDLGVREMRHHVGNTVQNIIAQLETTKLRKTAAGAVLVEDLESRLILSVRILDVLFGWSVASSSIQRDLEWLAGATVSLLSDEEQRIRTEVKVVGDCPESLILMVLHVAHEMVTNAVKHGMRMRLVGDIVVLLRTFADGRLALTVCDDGWGPGSVEVGEGHSIMTGWARQYGGSVSLIRNDTWTVATLLVPSPHFG